MSKLKDLTGQKFGKLEIAIKYRNELEEKYHKKEEIICPI